MTYREQVLQQALALSPADRAFVVAALAQSLSVNGPPLPSDVVEAASPDAISGGELLAELLRRSAAYKNGEMTARLAKDAIAELRGASMGEPSK